MSDYLQRLRQRALPKGYRQPDASMALQPYVASELVKKSGELSLMQPVKLIFDILQRGQYLTANVGESIIRSIRTGAPLDQAASDALSGAMEGITGRQKGDWTNVLFGGQSEGEAQKFDGLFPGSTLPQWAKRAIGFAANVALDPTTYVSFGATKGATAGAQRFAKDSMELFLKSLDANTLQRAITKGFDVAKAQKLAVESVDKAAQYISKFKGDLGRSASEVYRSAYKEAIRTPTAVLQEKMQGQLEKVQEPLFQRFAKISKKGSIKEQAQILESLQGLTDIAGRATTGYGRTGERALKLGPFGFGQELGASVRYPAHVQAWDRLTQHFAESPVGSKLSDAWWAVNNKGPLGAIRKTFGIRNPFESYVHNVAQSAIETERATQGVAFKAVNDVVSQIPDEVGAGAQNAIRLAEHLNEKAGKQITGEYVIRDPAMITQYINQLTGNDKLIAQELFSQVHGQDVDQLAQAIKGISSLTDQYARTAHDAVRMGAITNFGERLAYLPNVTVDTTGGIGRKGAFKGSETPAFTKTRSYTQTERIGQETAYVEWLFQVDKDTAKRLVEQKGIGNLSTDLREMLLYRAQGEARLRARMATIEDFKKFGIPVPDMNKALQLKVLRGTDAFRPVAGKAFEGLMFPTEVADILEKVQTSTVDPGMRSVKGMWNWFTSWWKGFVTMTTGFHARNFIQNEITMYLHHGIKSFDPREQMDAIVGAIHALAKDNPKPLLEQFAIGLDAYQRTLKKRIGNFSIEELADHAYYKGVISKNTQAFDVQAYGQATTNLNPMSRNFAGRQASQALGNIIENQAKMQSFLMDFKQAIKHSPEEWGKRLGETVPYEQLKMLPEFKQSEYALTFAANEAKKWFFDYGDLTDAEKNIFRQIIPFYSWIRKNIPAQLATIWTDPSIYSLFPKGQAALEMPGVDENLIPEWLRQNAAIPVFKDKEGKPVVWTPNLAYSDLNKIPFLAKPGGGVTIPLHELLMDVMSAAHPAIKTLVQMIPEKGYDVFQRKDLDYKATAPYLLTFFTKAPQVLQVLDGVGRVLGNPDGLGFGMKDGKLVMDAKIAKLLEDNLPILRAMERTMSLAQGTIPGLDEAIRQATGAKTKYDGMQAFFQTLSYWGGAKFNVVDLEKEKEKLAKEVYQAAQTAKSRAEAGSPLRQRRSLAYQKSQAARFRRVGL